MLAGMTTSGDTKTRRNYVRMLWNAGRIVTALGALLLLPSFLTGRFGAPLSWGMVIVGALMIGASYALVAKGPAAD